MSKRTSGRIKLPTNPKDILDLAYAVYQKHLADGKESLLHNLEGVDWKQLGEEIEIARESHQNAEESKRKMEESYRNRDVRMPNITEKLRGSGALLKAIFRQNPKKLGEWGFDIDDSSPVKKGETKP